MPRTLTAGNSRAPSSSGKKVTKITAWTSLIGAVLGATALEPVIVLPLASLMSGMLSAIGSELRNIQHTYEPGGSRDPGVEGNATQGPAAEFFISLFGKFL